MAAGLTSVDRPAGAQSAAERQGAWSPVYDWPNTAVHASLLPDGKVLTWAEGDNGYPGSNEADVVTVPAGGAPAAATAADNDGSNLFCSGHAFLPDGRLLVTGGRSGPQTYGHADINIFDHDAVAGDKWRTVAVPPAHARWYASALGLASGDVLLLAGNRDGHDDPNRLPQVWRQDTGGLRDLSSAVRKVENYSMTFLAPDGRVFLAGPNRTSSFLDPDGTGAWAEGPRHVNAARPDGTAVMYDRGKVLVAGGGQRGKAPTNTAEVIDLGAANPRWSSTAAMAHKRRHANATLLPDGKVLVTGGSSSPQNNNAAGAILPAEMWDPATGRWTAMASLTIPRIYHSVALLLPDGRVLAGGGDRPSGSRFSSHRNVQIYSPPYLFRGPRPTIASVSTRRLGYGQTFAVTTPDAAGIAKMTLVRLSSVTHSFNMNQRIGFLGFTRDGDTLTAATPANRAELPPGDYMLFILDGDGVPSVATMVNVG